MYGGSESAFKNKSIEIKFNHRGPSIIIQIRYEEKLRFQTFKELHLTTDDYNYVLNLRQNDYREATIQQKFTNNNMSVNDTHNL